MQSRSPSGFVYVDVNCCTNCGVPVDLAPEVFAWGRDTCYVKRQPTGPTELRRVLRVFRSQELDCIRYAGNDARVVRVLTRVGEGDKVDHGSTPRASTEGQGISAEGASTVGSFICRVDDIFEISGRGCVVTPGIPKGSDVALKVGDALVLRRPDGSLLHTVLRGIEMGGAPAFPGVPLLLGSELTKDQVPIGTEVWTA
jgi:hypothetical protein